MGHKLFSLILLLTSQWHNHGLTLTMIVCKQALLKLGESREDRLRRVTLQVNQDDVVFALQVVITDGKQHFQNVDVVFLYILALFEIIYVPGSYVLSSWFLNVDS